MTTPLGRLFAVVLLTVAGLSLLVTPASAHTELVSVNPADGSKVGEVPDEIVFTFSEELGEPGYAAVKIDDVVQDEGFTTSIEGDSLVVTPDASVAEDSTPPQVWTVAYRVVSADGHTVSGESSFTVAGNPVPDETTTPTADTPSPTDEMTSSAGPSASSQDADSSGFSAWWLIGGAAVLASLVLAVRGRRPSAGSGTDDAGESEAPDDQAR